ncbi:BMP/retinoic acid-inducible neural-specific protein 3 [Ameca splendens]|uniref:BMP/retinoic acid-inducible neural-specific protein 3 n=1 Tax=Ameca splendens TaxID=208324 RepID=A0ABV0ZZS1_9TELE
MFCIFMKAYTLKSLRPQFYRFCSRNPITTSFVDQVTETRTGPLGCSNYDNLDSVSSVLVQSPENKIHLQGLQAILPDYLRARFVQAALSYIGCSEEGQFVCRDNDCWCQCAVDYPRCNCPEVDLRAMEGSLLQIRDSWNMANQDFEASGQCYPPVIP